MKILFLNTPFIVKLTPRFEPIGTNLEVVLRNEMTDLEISNIVSCIYAKGILSFELPVNVDFKTQNKYEIILKNNSEIIYRGSLMFLEENTNIQSYENASQSNNRFQYS